MTKSYFVRFVDGRSTHYVREGVFFLTGDSAGAKAYDLATAKMIGSFLHKGDGRGKGEWFCVRDGFNLGIWSRTVVMGDRGVGKVVFNPTGIVCEIVDATTGDVVDTI